MKDDSAFWRESIEIFRQRLLFDSKTWAFSALHHDKQVLSELLPCLESSSLGSFFTSELLTLDPQAAPRWSDFHPLLNARAHKVGSQLRNAIPNREQRAAYLELLFALLEKPSLDDLDRLQLASYLLLQDRPHEAHALFCHVDRSVFAKRHEQYYTPESSHIHSTSLLSLQLDYLAAYFDFLFGGPDFTTARRLAARYARFPLATWRLLFFDIADHLRELDGHDLEEDFTQPARPGRSREAITSKLAATLEDAAVRVESAGITQATLKFYFVDLEVLFSRQPFLASAGNMREFSFVQPALVRSHSLSSPVARLEVPSELRRKNLVVEVAGAGKREFLTYFSTSLHLALAEHYGELKATDEASRPVPGVYVKVFVRLSSSSARFYKDGYTDIRGKFDYAQFTGAALPNVQRFALLLTHPTLGSLTREAAPPVPTKLTPAAKETGAAMMNPVRI